MRLLREGVESKERQGCGSYKEVHLCVPSLYVTVMLVPNPDELGNLHCRNRELCTLEVIWLRSR